MLKRIFNREPLLVEVQTDRWDCYGNYSRHHDKLVKRLYAMGGIHASVPPGYYHFNEIGFGPFKLATLKPWTER